MTRDRLCSVIFGMFALVWAVTAPPACAQPNPDRDAYFGEEHIHTSWSVDAWLMGNRLHRPRRCLQVRAGADHQAPAWV